MRDCAIFYFTAEQPIWLVLVNKDHPHHRMEFERAPIKGPWVGRTLTRMPPVLINTTKTFLVKLKRNTSITWHFHIGHTQIQLYSLLQLVIPFLKLFAELALIFLRPNLTNYRLRVPCKNLVKILSKCQTLNILILLSQFEWLNSGNNIWEENMLWFERADWASLRVVINTGPSARVPSRYYCIYPYGLG